MTEKKDKRYEPPRLVDLDLDPTQAAGQTMCRSGNKAGGQCLSGNKAGASCTTGNQARSSCVSGNQARPGACGVGNRAGGGCRVGSRPAISIGPVQPLGRP